jgi:hypothetical protein
MKGSKTLFTIFCILSVICLLSLVSTQAQTHSGRATAIKSIVTVPGVTGNTTRVVDTGPLPEAGGNISLTRAAADIPGVLTAGTSNASTSGSGSSNQSTTSVQNLNLTVLTTTTITADTLTASTSCACSAGAPACTGSSAITNLRINNQVIAVTGAPNQTIPLIVLGAQVGFIVINEQMSAADSVTVNALHVFFTDPVLGTTTDVVIASAHSDINCTPVQTSRRYSGRAIGVQTTVSTPVTSATTTVADTGPLPSSGGSITVGGAASNIPNLVSTGVLLSSTSGGGNSSQSEATVNGTVLLLPGSNIITADVLRANTACTCGPGCSGSSTVLNLRLNGTVINVTGAPNQTITIPLGPVTITIIINEQLFSPGSITVNALHVTVTDTLLNTTTDVIIASAHSDIFCLTTAANVSLAGRVIDPRGRGIARVRVTLTDSSGRTRQTNSTSFGYYRFEDLPASETYILEAVHKRYTFAPRIVAPVEDVTDFDFIAEEEAGSKRNGFRK